MDRYLDFFGDDHSSHHHVDGHIALYCIVEDSRPFGCGRHGSFGRMPNTDRERNRSRQPIEFWRQLVQQKAVRALRHDRFAYKEDWYRYVYGSYSSEVY